MDKNEKNPKSYPLVDVFPCRRATAAELERMKINIKPKVPVKLVKDAAQCLGTLMMYIERCPKDAPLLFDGDHKTPVTELYDFHLAKKTYARLDALLTYIEAMD